MKVANAPCSWGILEFGMEGNSNTYQKMLDEMIDTGYEGTELGDWGFLPTDPAKLTRELDKRQLNLVGAFVPVNFKNKDDHEAGRELALKTARLLADVDKENTRIVLSDDNGKDPTRTRKAGRIQSEDGLKKEEWEIFASGIEKVGRTVFEETGLSCVFHHHCGGFIETPDEIETLLDITDPELVGLCFDTGHYAFGGGKPLKGLKKFSDRIQHVHFKGWDPNIHERSRKNGWNYFESVEHGIFCELGKGDVNFKAILKELRKQNYQDWIVVEQDVLPGMGTPKESARRNREFLRSIGI